MFKRLLSMVIAIILLFSNTVVFANYNVENNSASAQQGDTFRQPVFIRSHSVDVEIRNQVARTRVTQVFVNESDDLAHLGPLENTKTRQDVDGANNRC